MAVDEVARRRLARLAWATRPTGDPLTPREIDDWARRILAGECKPATVVNVAILAPFLTQLAKRLPPPISRPGVRSVASRRSSPTDRGRGRDDRG